VSAAYYRRVANANVGTQIRRGRLLPDPRYDAVRVIALATLDDAEEVPDGAFATRCLLHCADAGSPPADALHGIQVPDNKAPAKQASSIMMPDHDAAALAVHWRGAEEFT
jgi:hypothetical protein